jgi:prolyl-tRNA editing enzyme YbaK/EbsC (Cys-tRNA(Pro) deacylase)
MGKELKPSAKKVQQAVQALGYQFKVVEFDKTTRTSADAATAIDCTVAQIAKSLIFKTKSSRQPVLVIASGANRVNVHRIGELCGEKIERADADFVREKTGYSIGGVPPIGHLTPITTYLDRDLFQHAEIWAAAGTPRAVFSLTPQELRKMTGGEIVTIK